MDCWLYLTAAGLGAAVGAAELVSRYRDSPSRLARDLRVYAYMLVNAGASAGTYFLFSAFGWDLGIADSTASGALQVLVSGLAAMVVLRSSVASVRVGSEDVQIGFQGLLDSVLQAIDRSVDRQRAQERNDSIASIMEGLDFEITSIALPPYCFSLLQNSRPEEEAAIGTVRRELAAKTDIPDSVKVRIIGLQLMTIVGPEVLQAAVGSLRTTLSATTRPPSTRVLGIARKMEEVSVEDIEGRNEGGSNGRVGARARRLRRRRGAAQEG